MTQIIAGNILVLLIKKTYIIDALKDFNFCHEEHPNFERIAS